MTAPHQRSRRLIAVPLGMAMTTALAFLPSTVASADEQAQAAPASYPVVEGTPLSYIVNTAAGKGVGEIVKKAIAANEGSIVATYDKIGVVVVHSSNVNFAKSLRLAPGVISAGATRTAPLPAQSTTDMGAPKVLTAQEQAQASEAAAAGQDPYEPLQWDLPAIKADQAHDVSLGSPDVTVGVIDTGVDDTHPDLAPNFSAAQSANCVTGKADTTPGSWRPTAAESPHGTHVAGEIAAAKNGIGMTGVAPGVKVAGIKVSTTEGFFYTEAVVCGFMWAADHDIDVTNNSYYTDPWYFQCTTDPDQKALAEAITRATKYAEHKGVVNVAAEGNENYDLTNRYIEDTTSPNDSTPVTRIGDTHKCYDAPTMLPGVVTVAATGAKGIKSSFSSYGLTDVAAPGGDSNTYQPPTAPATSGLILGTLPGGGYGYMAGTSMATPHVVAVAALIKSSHPDYNADQIKNTLYRQADDKACGAPYDINGDGTIDAVCKGTEKDNTFYGEGMVDALDAVTK